MTIKAYAPFPPIYRIVGERVVLMSDHLVVVVINGKPRDLWIPAGYDCDGASIPKVFWKWFGYPDEKKNLAGGIPHDYLYFTHIYPRWVADEIARQLWLAAGKKPRTARAMWCAVRVAGAVCWNLTEEDRRELGAMKVALGCRLDKKKFDLTIRA